MTYKELANDPEVLASLARIKAKVLRSSRMAKKAVTIQEKRQERKQDPYMGRRSLK